MYSTSSMLKLFSPEGVLTVAISPLFFPIKALPIGLLKKLDSF